jgi:hypothetical protein
LGWSGENTQKKTSSHVRTVVKADTPTATATKGNEQYSAPWAVESPGGTVTTSAYNDGKKRCLSAEEGSGNPKKKVSEHYSAFTRGYARGTGAQTWAALKEQRVRALGGRASVNGFSRSNNGCARVAGAQARKNSGVRVCRARKHQRARAGWAGGRGDRA